MTVIVTAEDDDDIRMVTARCLQRAGHTVVATADGAQALDAVRHHRPDMVITDVDMPHLTGLQLCRAIRDDPELQAIPVVLVSGSIHPEDPRAVQAGATDILSKPFLPSDLLNRVTALLSGSSAATLDGRWGGPGTESTRAGPPGPPHKPARVSLPRC